MTVTTVHLPDVEGATPNGDPGALYRLAKPGRYMLVWWHPQVLSPASCKTCGGNAEPIQLLMDIHEAGCDIVGLTYEAPERMQRYLTDIGLEYPVLSVTEDAARAHGVNKVEGEQWPSIPHRIAFLVNDRHEVINRYEVHEPLPFLRRVLSDVKAGPPESKWTPVKKRGWRRLLG